MNGCRGGSGTATGCWVAGWPENTGSEPAFAPSGIGCGGTASAGAASSRQRAAARSAGFTAGKDRASRRAEAPVGAARYCTARRLAVARRSARRPLAGRTAWSQSTRSTPSTSERSADRASP